MNDSKASPVLSATVEPKGAKFIHRVFFDGVEFENSRRTSSRIYAFAYRVEYVHADGTPTSIGASYGSKSRAIGSKIDGIPVVACVPVQVIA